MVYGQRWCSSCKKNSNLNEKSGKKMKKVFFSLYIKNGWSKLLSKKQRCDTRQRKYYENNKKLLRENAKNKYRNLSHKEKI